MIISHQHKFIFSKPRKVAGTSVEVALSKHCGPDDIITENVAGKDIDEDSYVDYARNQKGYYNHIKPKRIIKRIGKQMWDEYFTFTIVRNPWDMLVSRYIWNLKNATPRTRPAQALKELSEEPFTVERYGKVVMSTKREIFGTELSASDDFRAFLLKKLPTNATNTPYYFSRKGVPYNDFVIRYEHLDADYETVCGKIGIPYEPLPSLKTKTRTKREYADFYDKELQEWVAKHYATEIDTFGYTFERTTELPSSNSVY